MHPAILRTTLPMLTGGLWLLTLTSGLAQDPLLPPTYLPGREYIIRNTQHAETVLAVGAGQQAKSVADIVLQITALCQKSKGNAKHRDLTIELTSLKMDIKMGGLELNYHSTEPGSDETMLGQTFKNLVGKSFVVVMDEEDVIVDTRGLEQFAAGNTPLGQQFGPDQLKQIAMPALRLGVPMEGAAIGQTWKHQREMILGPGGELTADFDVTYARDEILENRDHGVLEYTAVVNADLETGGGANDPKPPLKIRDGRLHGAMSIDKDLRFLRTGMAITTMRMTVPDPANPDKTLELPVEQSMHFELISTRRLGLFER